MRDSDKVQSSAKGKEYLREQIKEKDFTQEKFAQLAKVSTDTIKRLLGTKDCPNGVERWSVTNIAKALGIEPTDIVDPKDWNADNSLPPEFQSLIAEKIKTFCGRRFVFDNFQQFVSENPHGYFTIIGDAGMGKSSIVAKYVSEHKSPCYFNILVERRNRPELFLKSIRQQLIDRYQLPNSENADLPTLLAKVAGKLPAGERLVIAIDALDEVQQEAGENLLHLPTTLPDRVYFLLTRRPYNLGKKRLSVSPGVWVTELDLRDEKYATYNQDDIKEYIRFALNTDPDYKNGLRNWIQTCSIADTTFVEQLADKSENNFMYLRYVLPAIVKGDYNDLSLKQLPDGLQEYYQNHWVRMGLEANPGQLMEIVLYILLEIGIPIPFYIITEIIKVEDECELKKFLEDEWVEYLKKQDVNGDIWYSIYHASFLEFLQTKRDMDSKRKIFKDVNQRIADCFKGNINMKKLGKLADKLKTKSPAFVRAYLGCYPSILINSGNLGKYYQTLTDFNFLRAKIQHHAFGVQAVIDDFDLIKDSEVLSHPDYNPEKVNKAINLIQNVVAGDESRPENLEDRDRESTLIYVKA
ncbi:MULTISPECIES: AAA family ATPase [unclassified Microcoleus]|uniref:AAA family ATPase n=1 Tax=unclassified Microcoleus TaxID=2642155 RepID=UPI002FD6330C